MFDSAKAPPATYSAPSANTASLALLKSAGALLKHFSERRFSYYTQSDHPGELRIHVRGVESAVVVVSKDQLNLYGEGLAGPVTTQTAMLITNRLARMMLNARKKLEVETL